MTQNLSCFEAGETKQRPEDSGSGQRLGGRCLSRLFGQSMELLRVQIRPLLQSLKKNPSREYRLGFFVLNWLIVSFCCFLHKG